MLPSPTADLMLTMSALGAYTAAMSAKKCHRFRSLMREVLGWENPKVTVLGRPAKVVASARRQAVAVLHVSCKLCPRREECPSPLA